MFLLNIAPHKIKRRRFNAIMKKYLSSAGIRLDAKFNQGLHILRHTLASELIRQGEAITTISAILGHTSSNATDTYSHIDIEGLLKCALDLQEVAARV